MTILTLDKKELEKLVGSITQETEEKITSMGTPIEEITNNEVSIEVFPNRPDLLSLQNFARSLNQFRGKESIANFKVYPPEKDHTIKIEKAVKPVRPYTTCAIVKGIKFDEEKIKEIIELQEKLHNSIGRKRKKVAIGIYPLDKISLPITFTAKDPQEIIFKPLEASREMNASQILRGHPTGREYGPLLKDKKTYPIFIDSENKILSMPPIINSEETGRITESTKEIFIECSGDNLHYLKKALNIVLATLYPMGGKVYSMNISDSKEGKSVSPDLNPEKLDFKIEDIEKTLGITLTEKQVKKYFERMGLGFISKRGKATALIPAYRTDILHWIDLTEEIAIAYGYENFQPIIPQISTIAKEDEKEKSKRVIANILIGLGLIEVSSYHLTNKKNIKKMHFDYKDILEVENSKNERDALRMDLQTNQMQILSENSDASYPQKVFEIGRVFSPNKDKNQDSETGITENENLAISLTNESVNFTELKQILDYLFKMLDIKYKLVETQNPNYINGRVGEILINEGAIGFIGEVSPRVLKNHKIKMPTVSLEINLEKIL